MPTETRLLVPYATADARAEKVVLMLLLLLTVQGDVGGARPEESSAVCCLATAPRYELQTGSHWMRTVAGIDLPRADNNLIYCAILRDFCKCVRLIVLLCCIVLFLKHKTNRAVGGNGLVAKERDVLDNKKVRLPLALGQTFERWGRQRC